MASDECLVVPPVSGTVKCMGSFAVSARILGIVGVNHHLVTTEVWES